MAHITPGERPNRHLTGIARISHQDLVNAENSGAIQPNAASDLLNHLSDIAQSISQGNLQDAGHKVGDLQHHLGDLTRNGQISARALAMIGPSVRELARLLPQQP